MQGCTAYLTGVLHSSLIGRLGQVVVVSGVLSYS